MSASDISTNPAEDATECEVDPLDGLIDRATANPGAAFEPEVLLRLGELRRDNRPAFENLRAELKDVTQRITALDDAIGGATGDNGGGRPSQVDILLEIASEADLFHTNDGTAFADFEFDSRRETWPVRSKGFKDRLIEAFLERTGGAPNSEAYQTARNAIEAMARFRGPQRVVCIRVGGHDGKIYLDLADDTWRAVEIDVDGWRIVARPPIRFRRTPGMHPLPEPVDGGAIYELKAFLNIKKERDFVLVVSWLLAALRNCGPYPILVLSGEQGSAKSTLSRVLRSLVDPNSAPLRSLPREDRELFIAAKNGHVLCFDNVSGLRDWLSDTLCRLATGGGFAVRQLYTDDDEVLFEATRPVILNGIEDFVTRPDLADRSILLSLAPIPEENRRTETELRAAFDEAHPRILGALLDAISIGLRRLPDSELDVLPRMADFALWSTACESAFCEEGKFMHAYAGNRDEAIDSVIEDDPVASVVRSMMDSRLEWAGTATDLLEDLSTRVGDTVRRSNTWPRTARALSGRLTRASSFLRSIGIEITRSRQNRAGTRTIVISRQSEQDLFAPSAPSAMSAGWENSTVTEGSGTHVLPTEPRAADTNGGLARDSRVGEIVRNSECADDADDADAENPFVSHEDEDNPEVL